MKSYVRLLFTVIFMFFLAACSEADKASEETKRQGKLEELGQRSANAIKAPLEQAKKAREITEQHNEAIEKSIESKE